MSTVKARLKITNVIVMKVIAVQYSSSVLEVKMFSSLENVQWKPSGDTNLWLDVSEYEKIEDLHALEKDFGLHPLALEDCIHTRQRPKIDDFHENLFLTCRTISQKDGLYVEGHQLGIFLGKNFVVTVHKEFMPQLNKVLEEIKRKKPELVERSSSFLLYTILDAIVDDLEDAVRQVEEMECTVGSDVLKNPPQENVLDLIYTNRSNLLIVSRLLRPQSHVVQHLVKGDFQLVNGETAPFFRDIYDHTLRTIDRVDNLLEMNIGSLNIYSSSVSNRMNEIMRLLTVMSTIGVPLTILVGWYGMNFHNMPEIPWAYGYVAVILIAVGLIAGTILLFRRKGWL